MFKSPLIILSCLNGTSLNLLICPADLHCLVLENNITIEYSTLMILHSKQLIGWSIDLFPCENPTLVFHCKAADQTRVWGIRVLCLFSRTAVKTCSSFSAFKEHKHTHGGTQTHITQSSSLTDPTAQLTLFTGLGPLIMATVHTVDEEWVPISTINGRYSLKHTFLILQ